MGAYLKLSTYFFFLFLSTNPTTLNNPLSPDKFEAKMTQEFNNHKSFTQLGHTAEFQQNLFADDCKKVGIITSI